MKTQEQIEQAQEAIKSLQDYVELAKIEKKLKVEAHKQQTNKMIDDIVSNVMAQVGEL